MKAHKIISITFLLMLTFHFGFAQSAEKTLVKSFNLQGNDVVELDLDGEFHVETWSNSIMRIQMTVGLENGSNSMLKSLVQVGRYNLKAIAKDGVFKVYAPGMQRDIRVKNTDLQENIIYTVYVPEDVTVKEVGASTAAVGF